MDHLTADQIEELRSVLERQLGRLEKSMKLSDEASRPVELDQTAVGRLSRMDSLQNQSMARNLAEREQVRLALIVGALRRIDAGTYGGCSECEGPVPFERLLIFPETATCQGCG
ncbi:MAG: hypothetical protein RH859_02510 [Longimicrobiales bacterium]